MDQEEVLQVFQARQQESRRKILLIVLILIFLIAAAFAITPRGNDQLKEIGTYFDNVKTNADLGKALYDRMDDQCSVTVDGKPMAKITRQYFLKTPDPTDPATLRQKSLEPHYSGWPFGSLDSAEQTLSAEMGFRSRDPETGTMKVHWHKLGNIMTIDKMDVLLPVSSSADSSSK